MNVICKDGWLVVSFAKPQTALSWAICGGGINRAKTVAWRQVKNQELNPLVDAKEFLKQSLVEKGVTDAIGMLTSADVSLYQDVSQIREGIEARCIATVGMTNALRIGDAPGQVERVGTINLLCAVSVPLSMLAMIEALSLAVEARTAAVMGASLPSIQSNLPATGTGTDCVALVCPPQIDMPSENYAGKHTVLGSLIGEVVYKAVESGLNIWKERCAEKAVLV